MSYYVLSVKKHSEQEKGMRFEENSRGINRSDYRQFADFLGLSHSRQQPRMEAQPRQSTAAPCCQGTCPIAMVYGVKQCFERIYEPELALTNGTVFEELNKPFYFSGCSSKCGEGCL